MECFASYRGSPSAEHEVVPYLGRGSYDAEDSNLSQEKQQKLHELHQLERGAIYFTSSSELYAFYGFLQDFLYLGLISSVLGSVASADLFTRELETPYGSHVLCTAKLSPLLMPLIDQGRKLSSNARTERYRKARAYLDEVRNVLRVLANSSPSFPFHGAMLSVFSLLYELLAAVSGAAFIELDYAGEQHGAIELTSGSSLVLDTLRKQSWCPREVWRIIKQYNTTFGYYATQIKQPGKSKNHSSCTSLVCDAYNVKEGTKYPFLHRQPEPCCSFVPIDVSKVIDTLKRNKVPIVRCTESGDDVPGIMVTEAEDGEQYVAISHVWSDGMGNPTENSMPACMLHYIQSLCKANDGSLLPFWIDTLCCPVEPEEATDLAISLMRETYSNATAVLVIDEWLSDQCHAYLQPEEILLHVVLSGWTKRLWTFQEGQLARQIFVLFADGLVHLNEIAREVRASLSPSFLPLKYYLVHDYMRLQGLGKTRATSSQTLFYVVEALKFRSTSVATDEALCLAGICRVSLADVVQVEPDLRMQQLWTLLPDIPQRIVFFDCPKLQAAGWRWAPATLRMPTGTENMFSQVPWDMQASAAVRTDEGLEVCFDGLIWHGPSSSLSPVSWLVASRSIKLCLLDQHGDEYVAHILTPAFKIWLSDFRGYLNDNERTDIGDQSDEIFSLEDSDVAFHDLVSTAGDSSIAIIYPDLDRDLPESVGGIGLLGALSEGVKHPAIRLPSGDNNNLPRRLKVVPLCHLAIQRKLNERDAQARNLLGDQDFTSEEQIRLQPHRFDFETQNAFHVIHHTNVKWLVG